MIEDIKCLYVYRTPDGKTQVMAPEIDDPDLVVDMLEEALRAMHEGEPIAMNLNEVSTLRRSAIHISVNPSLSGRGHAPAQEGVFQWSSVQHLRGKRQAG
jgi:hypothetical protein